MELCCAQAGIIGEGRNFLLEYCSSRQAKRSVKRPAASPFLCCDSETHCAEEISLPAKNSRQMTWSLDQLCRDVLRRPALPIPTSRSSDGFIGEGPELKEALGLPENLEIVF